MSKFFSIARVLRNSDVSETRRLYLLHKIAKVEIDHNHKEDWHKKATARRAFLRSLAEKAENGSIAMVWSGMDCDGVRYRNSVKTVKADVKSVMEAENEEYEWADGPCNYYLEKPSVAKTLQYSSRDLVLEAFEDGHPHSITY